MKKYKDLQQQIEESEESQLSFTDPDSRFMPLAGEPRTQVGYNVQVSVDEKHKLIVDHNEEHPKQILQTLRMVEADRRSE